MVFSGTHAQVMEVSLLLASQRIDHHISVEENSYQIKITSELADSTASLIRIYLEENKNWLTQFTQDLDLGIRSSPILYLLPMTIGYFFQFSSHFSHIPITLLGRTDSEKILAGDWWRNFTALTLHSGPSHYFSNMVSGYFLINLLVHRVPVGFSMWLLFLAGGLGNFAVAVLAGPGHRSIGFSTAVFSALGMLAAVQIRENFAQKRWDKRTFIPLFGAIFLLAFMGMGEGTDIKAHCLGLVTGVALGWWCLGWAERFKSGAWNTVFILAAYSLLGWAWLLALRPIF